MQVKIRPMTLPEVKAFFEVPVLPKLIDVYGVYVDGRLAVVSGVAPDPHYTGSLIEEEARIVGFIDVKERPPRFGSRVILAIRAYLKTKDHPIYAQRDESEPKSERILRVLGFAPTGETRRDKRETGRSLRIWRWPN